MWVRREGLKLADDQHGVSFHFERPSNSYLVYILLKVAERENVSRVLGFLSNHVLDHFREKESPRVLELATLMFRMRTLRIESGSSMPTESWRSYIDSFFFHICYNLDVALARETSLDEVLRPARISSMRRSGMDDLDAPRRHYVPDLVYHYQLGVSAESPMLEYLSYYHVVEHWFESIYQQDLVKRLQAELTDPSFSYKRAKDIQRVIRTVTKAVQLRDEELVISEPIALKLTLEKYVDIARLRLDLERFDARLVSYYAEQPVPFCGGDSVDLLGSNAQEVPSVI